MLLKLENILTFCLWTLQNVLKKRIPDQNGGHFRKKCWGPTWHQPKLTSKLSKNWSMSSIKGSTWLKTNTTTWATLLAICRLQVHHVRHFMNFSKLSKIRLFFNKNVSIFIAVSSPPMLHTGRKQVASCIHPVPIRPKAGLTLPVSGRQCYSAVTSPITSCKCSSQAASSSRPASTIPGLFSKQYCVNCLIFCSHFWCYTVRKNSRPSNPERLFGLYTAFCVIFSPLN